MSNDEGLRHFEFETCYLQLSPFSIRVGFAHETPIIHKSRMTNTQIRHLTFGSYLSFVSFP
jgi:hypothetical protein